MVDVSYTKRISEGGWLATLSTPLDQPLLSVANIARLARSPFLHITNTSQIFFQSAESGNKIISPLSLSVYIISSALQRW